MADRLGFSRTWLVQAIKNGLAPAPTAGPGRCKYYTEADVRKVRQAYNQRLANLLLMKQMGVVLGVDDYMMTYFIQHQILDAPTHCVGPGRRRYYHLTDITKIQQQYQAWQHRRQLSPSEKKCRHCWRAAIEGSVICQNCRDHNRMNQQRRRAEKKCSNCWRDATRGTKCELHADQAILSAERCVQRHKDLGLCISCNEPAEPGLLSCGKHLRQNKERQRRNYLRRKNKLL